MCLAQSKPVLYNSDLEQLVVGLHLLLGLWISWKGWEILHIWEVIYVQITMLIKGKLVSVLVAFGSFNT